MNCDEIGFHHRCGLFNDEVSEHHAQNIVEVTISTSNPIPVGYIRADKDPSYNPQAMQTTQPDAGYYTSRGPNLYKSRVACTCS
jgi:carbamoylphosphate synthase small subunit